MDDDWAIRAQATTQREEIQLLRGAVAALRATRTGMVSARGPADHADPTRSITSPVVIAFLLGVVVTAAVAGLFGAALCP